MPRGKPAPPPLDDDDDSRGDIVVSEKMANAVELAQHISKDAESAVVNLWNPETKELEYLATVPIEQYSFEYVRDQFGGGRYSVMFLGDSGKIVSKTAFTISRLFKGAVGAVSPPSSPAPVPGVSPEVAMLLGQMKGFEALIASQGVMMQGLIGALAGGAGKGKDPLDVGLEIARIIKDSTPAASADRLSVKDIAETFREGLQFGQMVVSGGEESGLVGVAKTFAPLINRAGEELLDKAKAGAPAAIPPAPAPAQVAPPKSSLGGPAPVQGTVDLAKAPWLIHLRPFIKEIEQAAVNGWDHEAYVRFMASRMPDAILDEINLAAQAPDFIENAIAALPPAFQAYRAWLTKALKALKLEAEPEEPTGPQKVEDDDDEPGSGGGQQ